MFDKLADIWDKHGFEIILGIAVFIILVFALFRIGKKGSWSRDYFYTSANKPSFPRKDSRGEIECRRVLENYFKRPFPKARPDIMVNPVTENYNLELDCYNSELKLACEYNGIQHVKYIPFFHKNREAFMNQKYRDHIKRELCAKNGIYLIEVPHTVKIQDIEAFIKNKISN